MSDEIEETSTEVAEVDPQQTREVEPAQPTADVATEWGSESLLRFVRDLQLAYRAANMLVSTSFVPSSYNGKPAEAAAAIVTGQGLGLDPLASLRSMDVIQGTPAFRAITIRAIVQSHGHEIWVEESNSQRAIVKGRRRGGTKVETSTWTMDRARALNLLGKPNWKNQAEAMLVARATSECGRLIAADALLGMAYSIEELEDGVTPEPAASESTKPRATRTVSRKQPAAPAAPPVPEFPCARCGREHVADEEGAICAECEVEVEAEIAAENEGQGS